jgi:hypothetical protein
MNQAEKNDILDQHKKVYDGFVTTYGQQINQQPLYVQDYANDKQGVTVSNKGVVKSYTNMNINEADAMTGAKYLPNVSFGAYGGPGADFESEYVGFGGQDMIGDSKTDMKHGTTDDNKDENLYDLEIGDLLDNPNEFEVDIDVNDLNIEDMGTEESEYLQEQINKTIDMFKRFKNF